MQMKALIANHISSEMRECEAAMHAVIEFVKVLPLDVLETDIDPSKADRRAVVAESSVFKFGLYPEPNVAFVEVYNNNEAQPTMSLYADDEEKSLRFCGMTGEKHFVMRFFVSDGAVEHTMELE